MKKRQLAILAGIAVLVLAWLLKNSLAETPPVPEKSRKITARAIAVTSINNGDCAVHIRFDGPVRARQKIELYAEVTGILQSSTKRFEAGQRYRKGEVILALDDREARSTLRSARSEYLSLLSQVLPDLKIDYPQDFDHWYRYLQECTQRENLNAPPRVENEKLSLFLSGRGVYTAYQNWESAAVRLSKFTIRAPFEGELSEALVDPGSLVRSGQLLGEFMGGEQYEMETSVGASEIDLLAVGDSVKLLNNSTGRVYRGLVSRKTNKIDPNSQRVKIIVALWGKDLHDGQYLQGNIAGQIIENAVALPRKLINDKDKIYTVQDSVLMQKSLQILHKSPGEVIVRGLPDGSLIPSQPIPGAYEGMPVSIISRS